MLGMIDTLLVKQKVGRNIINVEGTGQNGLVGQNGHHPYNK